MAGQVTVKVGFMMMQGCGSIVCGVPCEVGTCPSVCPFIHPTVCLSSSSTLPAVMRAKSVKTANQRLKELEAHNITDGILGSII